MPKPDDLIDALVDKLGKISPKWTATFSANPAGYKKLQKLVSTYGYPAVRSALQFALDFEVVPENKTAMPVLTGILKAHPA